MAAGSELSIFGPTSTMTVSRAKGGRALLKEDEARSYVTLARPATAEIVVRKSRFIAHVSPVSTEEEAVAFIEKIRGEHRDATHNVFAYTVGWNPGVVRQSDDGEPSGTSGRPTLEVLQREGLNNVACVVTRYFGGILLGAGGLVRAYSSAAHEAVKAAGRVRRQPGVELEVTLDYTWLGKVQHILSETEGAVSGEPVYTDRVSIPLWLPFDRVEELTSTLKELSAGQIEIARRGWSYRALAIP